MIAIFLFPIFDNQHAQKQRRKDPPRNKIKIRPRNQPQLKNRGYDGFSSLQPAAPPQLLETTKVNTFSLDRTELSPGYLPTSNVAARAFFDSFNKVVAAAYTALPIIDRFTGCRPGLAGA